jgi:hypothetical protein
MKRSLPQIQYSRLLALYQKLNDRLNRHFALGRFHQFSKEQQYKLLCRIEKIKAQLSFLERKAKLAGAFLIVGTILSATEANAQFSTAGSEFQVNTYTTNNQFYPSVAVDSLGDFVATWQSYDQEGIGSYYGIYAQRYNASGVAQGSEFKVNTYTTNQQTFPSIAMDSLGDFVISWMSYGQDGSNWGIYAQRYNAAGVAQGPEFKVNTYTTNQQQTPSIAMDNHGNFVITWQSQSQDGSSYGVYAQRYNAAGVAQGSEYQINTYTTDQQKSSSIAMDNHGDFVISWESYGQDGNNNGVYAQRYNALGIAQGSEFKVNTYTTSAQRFPKIAKDSQGDFVISWQSYLQDGSKYGIYAQRYNASGVVQGSEFKVNTYTTSYQISPSIAMDSQGDFVISWMSKYQDGSLYGVYAQRYNVYGVAQGSEFLVNTYTANDQMNPCVAMDNGGDFVISWRSQNQDGSQFGIYAQRYTGGFSNITAVEGQTAVSMFSIYPNPAKGQVQVSLEGQTSVRVLDLSGHLVKEETLESNTLNIESLKAGVYMIEVIKNDRKEMKKLVVE